MNIEKKNGEHHNFERIHLLHQSKNVFYKKPPVLPSKLAGSCLLAASNVGDQMAKLCDRHGFRRTMETIAKDMLQCYMPWTRARNRTFSKSQLLFQT